MVIEAPGFGDTSNYRRFMESEHGPQGGDEINLIEPGNNYGWLWLAAVLTTALWAAHSRWHQ